VVTKEGVGLRELALAFSITPGQMNKVYTGGNILPEKLEELKDFEREEREPFSCDNLVCPKCEDKLSRLEAIFATEFSEKKLKAAFDNNKPLLVSDKYNPALYELFVQSIFYRCSIGRYSGFLLYPSVEQQIAENLRKAFLIPNFNKIKPDQALVLAHSFPVITANLALRPDEDTTARYIVIKYSRIPYTLFAGKWIFQLFEKEKHIMISVVWNFGATEKIRAIFADNNLSLERSEILLLNAEESELISKNLVDYVADKEIRDVKKKARQAYSTFFGAKPNDQTLEYIFQQYGVHLKEGVIKPEAMRKAFYDFLAAIQQR